MRNKFVSLLTLSCHVPPTDHSTSLFFGERERERGGEHELEAV